MAETSELLGYLNGEKSYLINLNPENIDDQIMQLLGFLLNKRNWSGVYVCANKSSDIIMNKIKKKKLNLKKFFFIDAVQSKPNGNNPNVSYVNSPSALTEINTRITQLSQLNQSQGFVLIDSIDGFLLNNDENILARFIRSLVASTSRYKSKILFLTTGGSDKKLLNKIKPFFDKVIYLEKEK